MRRSDSGCDRRDDSREKQREREREREREDLKKNKNKGTWGMASARAKHQRRIPLGWDYTRKG